MERREIHIEVIMLRVQRHSYRTYLLELRKRVKEMTRTKRKLAEKEKMDEAKNEVLDDLMEIFSHNCIKLSLEQDMTAKMLRFAVDQLRKIRKSRWKVDAFISMSEAEINEMRHRILKK